MLVDAIVASGNAPFLPGGTQEEGKEVEGGLLALMSGRPVDSRFESPTEASKESGHIYHPWHGGKEKYQNEQKSKQHAAEDG